MTPELLRTELAHAEEAELRSDEQVRELTAMIDKATSPNATINPANCLKLTSAALALNARLRQQKEKLRHAVQVAERMAAEARRTS